jgi:TonB-linked SusC/RagA family outer membrane protein
MSGAIRITFLTAISLLTAICALWAYPGKSQDLNDVKVSLDVKHTSFRDIFDAIEKQTVFRFVYNTTDVPEKDDISFTGRSKPLGALLDQLLGSRKFSYRQAGQNILIKKTAAAGPGGGTPADSSLVGGHVTDEKGEALSGVTVRLKGSNTATVTDASGNFRLHAAQDNPVLLFSFVGYNPREVHPEGDKVEVRLSENGQQLSAVMVTALGFRESTDRQAATGSRVSGQSLVNSGENTFLNGLAGKASNVQINRSSGDPGAGSFIQIRGLSTLTGDNQPLVIVDGLPISNSTIGGAIGGVVQESRLNDINPNDIVSIQVLKGASAAALWGSRAANGVIIISTRSGNKDKLSITFNSTAAFDNVNVPYHPRQTAYGQGAAGIYSPTAINAWGDKISDRAGGADDVNTSGAFFQAASGKKYYPIVKKNSKDVFAASNYDQVFRTGLLTDNNLGISGGTDKSTYYFSAGDLNQRGVLNGNSDYNRASFKLNTERRFNNIFRITTNSTFTKTASNRIGRSNSTSGVTAGLLRTAPDFDVTDYKGSYYSSPTASPVTDRQRTYRSYLGASANPLIGNPLWALHDQRYTTSVNRFINSVEINIKPVSWFDLTGRAGYDTYTDERMNYFPINDYQGAGKGTFTEETYKESQWSTDLIGRIKKSLGEKFVLTYIAGFSVNDRQYYSNSTTATNFIIPNGPANFTNATAANIAATDTRWHTRTARAYNTANLAFDDALFVNVSAAGEAGSAFGALSDKTFYYPSADIAWQFSQLPAFKSSSVLSFGKLRASYGVVGVQPLPYKTQTAFVSASFNEGTSGGINDDYLAGSQYGNGAFLQNTEQGNSKLRPEKKTEYEFGADLRFFDNRVRAGITYYRNEVKDMLIPVGLSPSTGFITSYSNAASMKNRGIEADLGVDIIRSGGPSKDLSWSIYGNFSRNRNTVTDLAGTTSLSVATSIVNTVAVVGRQVGVLWGGRYSRNKDGSMALDANGFPRLDANQGVIGDPNPKWEGGLGTTLSWKKLTLDVLFETSQGGAFYEGTRGVMYNFGTHADVGHEVTLKQATKNYAGTSFAAGSTVRGNVKDFGAGAVLLDEPFYTSVGGGFGGLSEQWISDGSWTRLRQLSLSYHWDTEWFHRKLPFQSIDVGFTGRNLFLWTKIKGIDPDTNISGTLLAKGQDYSNTPNTRSFIFTLKITY